MAAHREDDPLGQHLYCEDGCEGEVEVVEHAHLVRGRARVMVRVRVGVRVRVRVRVAALHVYLAHRLWLERHPLVHIRLGEAVVTGGHPPYL